MYLIINIEQYIFIWTQKIYFEKSFLCNILYNNSFCEKSMCLCSEGTITYDRFLMVVRGGAGGGSLRVSFCGQIFEISEEYTYPVNTLYEHVNENNRNSVTHSHF